MSSKQKLYEVVLSFTEAQRDAVVALNYVLESQGVTTYYYYEKQERNLGVRLPDTLAATYQYHSTVAVAFWSYEYFKKHFCILESRAIKRRLSYDATYLIPISMEVGGFDWKRVSSEFSSFHALGYFHWNSNPKEVAKECAQALLEAYKRAPQERLVLEGMKKLDQEYFKVHGLRGPFPL